jgi:hypothetical protein
LCCFAGTTPHAVTAAFHIGAAARRGNVVMHRFLSPVIGLFALLLCG